MQKHTSRVLVETENGYNRKVGTRVDQTSIMQIGDDSATNASLQHDSRGKMSAAILATVQQIDVQSNMVTSPASHEDNDVVFPYLDFDRDSNMRLYVNNSKVISDDSGYIGQPYTPLTAPELDLVNVVRGHNMSLDSDVSYSYSSHKEELSWLIPALFVGAFILFVLVYVLCYGLKSLRVKVMALYFTVRRLCEAKGQSSREETDSLTSSVPQQQVEMNDYHTNGDSWEYDRFIL